MKRHALFVGVDQYTDPTIQNLEYPSEDAAELASVFRRLLKFDRVEKLVNPAHAAEVLDCVDALTGDLGPGDLFLFFFAGHGLRVKENHVLVCARDKYAELEDEYDGLPVGRLKKRMRGAWSRMLVLDACQNDIRTTRGADTGFAGRDLELIHTPEFGGGDSGCQIVVTSCSEGQKALEVSDLRHGLFTSALLDSVTSFADARRRIDIEALRTDLGVRMGSLIALYNLSGKQEPFFTMPANAAGIVLLDGAAPIVPTVTATAVTSFVVCPICGKKNRPEDTFKCRECGRDDLCLEHQDKTTFLCIDCVAENARKEAEEQAREKKEAEHRAKEKAERWMREAAERDPGTVRAVSIRNVSFNLRWIPANGEWPGFWMAETPVTQALWRAVVGKAPARAVKDENCPVRAATWDDCQEFLSKINAQCPDNHSDLEFRLPCATEWQFACRAGGTGPYGRFADGTDITKATLDRVCWVNSTSIRRVGRKEPNAWGLFDAIGFVNEWTQSTEGFVDFDNPSAEYRVVCGGTGSWNTANNLDTQKYVHDTWVGGFRFCASFKGDEAGRLARASAEQSARASNEAKRKAEEQAREESRRKAREEKESKKRAAEEKRAQAKAEREERIRRAREEEERRRKAVEESRACAKAEREERKRVAREEKEIRDREDAARAPGTVLSVSIPPVNGGTRATTFRMNMRWIPATRARRGFWLGETPVTQELWKAVMGNNPSRFRGHDYRPVEGVSLSDCARFIEKMNKIAFFPLVRNGWSFRLPTSEEWKFACRAGGNGDYCRLADGTDITERELGRVAWFKGNSGTGIFNTGKTTHPVGEKEPNAWGLFDMLGNVRETTVGLQVAGGCFEDTAKECTSYQLSRRVSLKSDIYQIGVRLCLSRETGSCDNTKSKRNTGNADSVQSRLVSQPESAGSQACREGKVCAAGSPPAGTRRIVRVGAVDVVLRWCPPGTFTMGAPVSEEGRYGDETQHRVTLTKGFWMGEVPVTQELWEEVIGSNPAHPFYCKYDDDYPMHYVSWDQCQEFLEKLNSRSSQSGLRWALPTEAQWEYACRAGTTGAYGGTGRLDDMGWYRENSRRMTRLVKQKQPNAWGFYDMHGNVEEWCQDWYGDYPSGAVTDPSGPAYGERRVIRGGSWCDGASCCRSASRAWCDPSDHHTNLGFRVALSPVQ